MTITANDLQKTLTKEINENGSLNLKARLEAKSSNLSGNDKMAVDSLRSVLTANGDKYNEIDISKVPSFISALDGLDGDETKLSTDINSTNEAHKKEALALRALFKGEGSNIGLSTWTDSTQGSDLMFNNDFLPKTSSNPLQVLTNFGQNTIKLFTSWEDNKGGPGSFALKILGPEANTYADRLASGDYQAWIDMYTNSKSGGRSKTIDPNADISRAGSTSKNIGAFAMAHLVKLPNTVDGFKSLVEKALPKQDNPIISIFTGSPGNFTINLSNIGTSLSNIHGVSVRLNELQKEYSGLSPKEIKNRFAAILAKSTIGVENPSIGGRKFDLKLKTDVLLDELFPNLDKDEIKKALKLEGSIMLKDMELTQPSFDKQNKGASDSPTYGILNKVFNNKETNKNNPNYKEPKEKTGISFTIMNPLTTISLNV